MLRVKIFQDTDVESLEKNINSWLDENMDKFFVTRMMQSESSSTVMPEAKEDSYSLTVSLWYTNKGGRRREFSDND